MRGLKPGLPKVGDRFVIDQGDGDQTYFSAMMNAVLVDLRWTHSDMEKHGAGVLFEVTDGVHAGAFIAATGRGEILEIAFAAGGYSRAIVWRVVDPFSATPQISNIGMTVIWRLGTR